MSDSEAVREDQSPVRLRRDILEAQSDVEYRTRASDTQSDVAFQLRRRTWDDSPHETQSDVESRVRGRRERRRNREARENEKNQRLSDPMGFAQLNRNANAVTAMWTPPGHRISRTSGYSTDPGNDRPKQRVPPFRTPQTKTSKDDGYVHPSDYYKLPAYSVSDRPARTLDLKQLKSKGQSHVEGQTGSPQTHVKGQAGSPQTYTKRETVSPQSHVKSQTGSPQTHVKSQAGSPQAYVRGNTGSPQTHVRGNTGSPQTHVRGNTGSPQTHVKSQTGSPQTHIKGYTGSPQFAHAHNNRRNMIQTAQYQQSPIIGRNQGPRCSPVQVGASQTQGNPGDVSPMPSQQYYGSSDQGSPSSLRSAQGVIRISEPVNKSDINRFHQHRPEMQGQHNMRTFKDYVDMSPSHTQSSPTLQRTRQSSPSKNPIPSYEEALSRRRELTPPRASSPEQGSPKHRAPETQRFIGGRTGDYEIMTSQQPGIRPGGSALPVDRHVNSRLLRNQVLSQHSPKVMNVKQANRPVTAKTRSLERSADGPSSMTTVDAQIRDVERDSGNSSNVTSWSGSEALHSGIGRDERSDVGRSAGITTRQVSLYAVFQDLSGIEPGTCCIRVKELNHYSCM